MSITMLWDKCWYGDILLGPWSETWVCAVNASGDLTHWLSILLVIRKSKQNASRVCRALSRHGWIRECPRTSLWDWGLSRRASPMLQDIVEAWLRWETGDWRLDHGNGYSVDYHTGWWLIHALRSDGSPLAPTLRCVRYARNHSV